MGNAFTSNAKWCIQLDHEHPGTNLAIIAGNTLTGKVIVKVHRQLPTAKLLLRLKGVEKTKVVQGAPNHQSTHRSTLYGKRVICGATVVLREAGTAKVFPGTYVFPFEIDLPVTLPSSTTGGDGIGNCSIYYRLAVDAYHNGSSQSPKIVKSYFNVASAPLPDELAPALVSPRSLRVESFGVNRGTLGVAARVVDVHVGRGTDLKLYLACRNDATASIYQFKVELVESLEWYGDRSRQSNSSTKILAQLSDVDLPGILRGKKDKQEVREDIRRGGVASHELEWLYDELQSENNMVTLTVPFGCRDTYSGTLIKISHYLKITMFTHAMVSNPSVQIPLRIGFPPRLQRQESPRPLRPSEPAMLPQVSGQSPSSSFATPAFAPTEPAPIASAEPYPLPMAQPYDTPRSLSIRSLPDMEIPMAEAFIIPIDDDAVQHPFASAPPEGLVLGGDAIYSEVESSIEAQPVALPSSAPAMDGLLREMLYSIDDFEIISNKLRDQNWASLLSLISPDEYGSIIAHVNLDMDQPRVAEVLANNMSRFTCEHVRAAAKNAADWGRATMVQRVLPYCVDVVDNHGMLQEGLTLWEQTITNGDFERAICERDRR